MSLVYVIIKKKKKIAEIKKRLYVDDLISGGINTTLVKRLKQLIINIFREAQFILYKWHSGRGTYKQFVSYRVNKIKDFINWGLVPTDRNPADIGGRSCSVDKNPKE